MTTLPTITPEERRLAGSTAPLYDPWIDAERELIDAGEVMIAYSRGERYGLEDAESLIQTVARRFDPDSRPFEDSIYWAGFQITGW